MRGAARVRGKSGLGLCNVGGSAGMGLLRSEDDVKVHGFVVPRSCDPEGGIGSASRHGWPLGAGKWGKSASSLKAPTLV